MSWTALAVGIVFNALANILIKIGVNRIERADEVGFAFKTLQEPFLYGGVVSFALALGAYAFVLSRLELSIAYPMMTSLGLIIVALASMVLFGETFSIQKIAGTVFIIMGVVLLTL